MDTEVLEAPQKRGLSVYATTLIQRQRQRQHQHQQGQLVSLQYAEQIRECMLVLGEVPSCKYPPHAIRVVKMTQNGYQAVIYCVNYTLQ